MERVDRDESACRDLSARCTWLDRRVYVLRIPYTVQCSGIFQPIFLLLWVKWLFLRGTTAVYSRTAHESCTPDAAGVHSQARVVAEPATPPFCVFLVRLALSVHIGALHNYRFDNEPQFHIVLLP